MVVNLIAAPSAIGGTGTGVAYSAAVDNEDGTHTITIQLLEPPLSCTGAGDGGSLPRILLTTLKVSCRDELQATLPLMS